MSRKMLGLSLSLLLFFSLLGSAFATPDQTNAQVYTSPGSIYYGATPPGSSSKPVLLFVHGYNSDSTVWYTNNDMFNYAYNAGFRTAAVSLYPGGSIWANGQLLANLIQQICAHYKVSSVNIIAHSKGGVDTQAAVVFYGAGPYVQNVVTLDTPHKGTELADLDYSWWASWLGAIFGQHSDATYDLQTSYMAYFRSITDGKSNNNYMHMYTTAGTYNFSPIAYFFGGLYLDQYDANDGVVPVFSTYNPEGKGIYTFNSNHDDVKLGHVSFNVIKPYISSLWRTGNLAPRIKSVVQPTPVKTPAPLSNQILRGGKIPARNVQTENIQVEPGVTNLKLELLSENSKLNAVAIAPDGQEFVLNLLANPATGDSIFKAAQHFETVIAKPQSGTWRIVLNTGKSGTANYLLMSNLQSNLKLNLTMHDSSSNGDPQVIYKPDGLLNLNLSGVDAKGQPLHNLHVEGAALHNGDKANLNTPKSLSVRTAGDTSANSSYRLPKQEGVYNLSLTVTGTTIDGQPFERSLTTSIIVGSQASLDSHSKALEGK